MELVKSISVIIPNYNGKHLLQEYLPYNLEVIRATGADYELIVVDDASKDDSVEFIRKSYPEIKLIINPENRGFSFSCNRGIEASEKELILLLNSDVKLMPGYFDEQWKYFLRWDTFGVMGRIADMEGDHIQDAARMPKLNGFKLKTDYFYYSNSEKDRLYTFYLSGANALVSAEKLKKVGGFFEIFSPFYCEDMELSLRAWRLKWKCYYEHSSICRHLVSASTKNYETAKRVKSIYFRNRLFLHAIHFNGLARLGWYCQVILVDLLPKLLLGQTWIWKSYRGLFEGRAAIRQCREKISALADELDSDVSVFAAVKKIRNSVKNKRFHRFKP